MTTLQTLAVESVQRRGFHRPHNIPELAHYSLLAAQVFRLDEETGELAAAVAAGLDAERIGEEAADVQIVAFQIAHLTRQDVQQLHPRLDADYLNPSALHFLALRVCAQAGELCRALRKNELHQIDAQLGLLWLALSRLTLAAGAGDLGDCILAKLRADEGRGERHGEPAPANPQPGVRVAGAVSLGDPNLSDLGEEHNVYTDGPILSGGAVPPARILNHHIWMSEEPGAYSHNGHNGQGVGND